MPRMIMRGGNRKGFVGVRVLTPEEIVDANENGKKVIVQLGFYTVFTILLSVCALYSVALGPPAYSFRQVLQTSTFESEIPSAYSSYLRYFTNIVTVKDVVAWLDGVFADEYLPNDLDANKRSRILQYNFQFGAVRLRQLRANKGSCGTSGRLSNAQVLASKSFQRRVAVGRVSSTSRAVQDMASCVGAWSYSNDFTQPFGPDHRWKWASSQSNYELPHWGLFQFYGGGGYNVDVFGSAETFKTQLYFLLENGFLDSQTRALFVDTSSYNPALNIFAVVRILFEFTPAGTVLPSYSVRLHKLNQFVTTTDFVIGGIEIVVLLFNVYFFVEEIRGIWSEGFAVYRQDLWNIIDLIIILGIWIVFALRVQQIVLWQHQMTNNVEGTEQPYVPLFTQSNIMQAEMHFLALLLLCSYWKMFKFLGQALVSVRIFVAALVHAFEQLKFFVVILFTMLWAFVLSGNIAFSAEQMQWASISKSWFSTIQGILGAIEFDPLYQTNRLMGPLWYFLFHILVFYILMNMFVTIVSNGYMTARRLAKPPTVRFDFIADWIMKPFKKLREMGKKAEVVDSVKDAAAGQNEAAKTLPEAIKKTGEQMESKQEEVQQELQVQGSHLNKLECAMLEHVLGSKIDSLHIKMLQREAGSYLSDVTSKLDAVNIALLSATGLLSGHEEIVPLQLQAEARQSVIRTSLASQGDAQSHKAAASVQPTQAVRSSPQL